MPTVSAVIPSKDRFEKIQSTLEDLRNQESVNLEIIVVDDCSEKPYEIDAEDVTVLRNSENSRVMYSRNRGISKAKGDYILVTDDDIGFRGEDWVKRGVEKMEEEKIDILFPKKYDHIGGEVKEVSTFRMRRFDGSPRPVDSEEGSVIFGPQVILARKEVFEDIGGYDTVYGKKEGYCWMGSSEFPARAAAAGYSLYYWPDLVIDHFIGEYQSNPRKEYWIAHNQVIFNIRNLRFGWIRALGYLFYDTILANLIYWRPRQLLPQMRGAIQGVVDAISPGEFGPCDGFER